jgi:nucleoside-triphosphatase
VGELVDARGFVTGELRAGGRRVGFAVETLEGERAVLAHVDLPGLPRVGRYGVDLQAFERVALPVLDRVRDGDVIVVDELGKMELASDRFVAAFERLLERPVSLVATVHVFRHPFTDRLERRPDVEVIRVTSANGDLLPGQLATRMA